MLLIKNFFGLLKRLLGKYILCRMTSRKTDFLCTLHRGSVVFSKKFYKMAHKHEQGTVLDFQFVFTNYAACDHIL